MGDLGNSTPDGTGSSARSPAPLRILWTLPYLPWPTTSGGKLRQYHLLCALAERGHQITLLVQSKEALGEAVRARLDQVVERLIVLPRRPLKHPGTLLAAAFAPYPLLASVNGLSAELSRRFRLLLDEPWDVVQIEHSYAMQPFLGHLRQRRCSFLLTEHNLESSLGAATYQQLPGWMKPFVVFDRWRYRRWERRVLRAASRVAAVTAEDAAAMAEIRQGGVDVVINGVDTVQFARVAPRRDSRRVLFVGNFEYPPNRDAVQWSIEAILPQVWKVLPDARFAVCGYAMPPTWPQRWQDPRIEWVGYAPDLTLEQGASAVFLAALREGGGSKLKVLEALAAGLALVSTPQGVSGLALRDGLDYAGGDSASALAEATVRLLRQPELAGELGEAGRRHVGAGFDWSVAAGQLEALYLRMTHAHRD